MVRLTCSLAHWLWNYDREKMALISMGHLELFTPEMQKQYLDWVQTDEGKEYLEGGSKYKDVNEMYK